MPRELLYLLLGYLVGINLLGFFLMGLDKHRAKRNRWRISEVSLFLPAILGGSLGSLLGMHLFHHKTRRWYFRWGFSALLVVWIMLLGLLVWREFLSTQPLG